MSRKDAFNNFFNLLVDRIDRGIYTTEDSLRYVFFDRYLAEMCSDTHSFIAEIKYDETLLDAKISNLKSPDEDELDARFNTNDNQIDVVELKYNRKSNSNPPKTAWAGSLFNDIARLSLISNADNRFFIYVTDEVMNNYFLASNKRNLKKFYEMSPGDSVKLRDVLDDSGNPKTFLDEASKSFIDISNIEDCLIRCISKEDRVSTDNTKSVFLRIYSIERIDENNHFDIDSIWERIKDYAGQLFYTSMGREFTYRVVSDDKIVPIVNNKEEVVISKNVFEKALGMTSLSGAEFSNKIMAPAYVRGILRDSRIDIPNN